MRNKILPRPSPRLRGLAAKVNAVASATFDPLARETLERLIPLLSRMELTLDELVAESMAEAHLPGTVFQ